MFFIVFVIYFFCYCFLFQKIIKSNLARINCLEKFYLNYVYVSIVLTFFDFFYGFVLPETLHIITQTLLKVITTHFRHARFP